MEQSKEFSDAFTSSLRDGRGMDYYLTPYSPIFYWIGWIFVAYTSLYILSYYIAPAIFGYTPGYYYPPPFGKNLRKRRAAEENPSMTKLAFNILSQIDTFLNKINEEE